MAQRIPGATLAAGVSAALRGLRAAIGSPEVRKTYLQLALAIFLLATTLEIAGIWGIWEWTRGGADTGIWATVGLWILRVAGIAIVLLVAPVLSVLIADVVFPVLNQRVFLAGLRNINPTRAEELAEHPGVPLLQSTADAVVRLLLFVGLTISVLLFSLVPVIGGLMAPWLQAYVTARFLGWELLDPYFDKLGWRIGEQRAYVGANAMPIVGFALPYSFVMAVPIVGPLFFGVAQGAAATLVHDVLEAGA